MEDKLEELLSLQNPNKEKLIIKERIYLQLKEQEGFSTALMGISCNITKQYPEEIQLNAAIQLKNYINEKWNHKQILVPLKDQEFIKSNIITAMLYCVSNSNLVKLKMFNQCLKKIIFTEFNKDNYRTKLKETIKNLFDSKEPNKIFIGILYFYQLSKISDYEIYNDMNKKYKEMFNFFNEYFILFLNNCIDFNNTFQNMLMYKVLKIFYKGILFSLSNIINNDIINLEKWYKNIERVIKYNITIEMSKNILIRKLKKISFGIIQRITHKHNQKHTIYRESHDIEMYLKNNLISRIYTLLENVFLQENFFFYEENISLIYKIFNEFLLQNSFCSEILKVFSTNENKDRLIKDIILSDCDIENWYQSSKMYLINQMEMSMVIQSKRYLIVNLINSITSFKENKIKQSPLLCEYLTFFVEFLQKNEGGIEKEKQKFHPQSYQNEYSFIIKNQIYHHKIKESILYILENIKDKIITYYPSSLQILYQNFILKELDSPIGFLRERTCSFIKQFGFIQTINQDILIQIIRKLCSLFENDSELPVKVFAGLTIPTFLKYNNCKELISQNLRPMMVLYLKVLKETELDSLMNSINSLINEYPREIKEFIVPFSEYFADYLKSEMKKEINSDIEELSKNDISIVIDSMLKMFLNITSIFFNDSNNICIADKIEALLYDILKFCLSNEGEEHFEEGISIIISILQSKRFVSNYLWSLYDDIINSNYPNEHYYEMNYNEEIITSICFFISKDTQTFLNSDKDYIGKTLIYFEKNIDINKGNSENLRYFYQIPIIILECCRNKRVDTLNASLLSNIVVQFDKCSKYQKLNFGELFSSCISYNTNYAIKFIALHNEIFDEYKATFKKIKKEIEIRRYIFALCSLVTSNETNEVITSQLVYIFKYILYFGIEYLKKNKNNNKENENDDSKEDDLDVYSNIILTDDNEDISEKEEEEEIEDYYYQEISCLKNIGLGKFELKDIIKKTIAYLFSKDSDFENKIQMDNKMNNMLKIIQLYL